MSSVAYLPFETMLRNFAEHGQKVVLWCYLILAVAIIVTCWPSVVYTRVRGRRVEGLSFIVVSQISLGLIAIAIFYGRLWLAIPVVTGEIILTATVPKLRYTFFRALTALKRPD